MSQAASQATSTSTGGSIGADAPAVNWTMIVLVAGAVLLGAFFLFRKGGK